MSLYRRTFLILFVYMCLRVLLSDYLRVMYQSNVTVVSPIRTFKVVEQPKWTPKNEFNCHYLKDNGILPVLNEAVFIPMDSIFFVDSSCMRTTARQACSVESAARANPDRQVNVLFTSPVESNNTIVKYLSSIANVKAYRIHIEHYALGTPLYAKFMKNPLVPDDLNMDLADILKFLTIYKYPGTYLTMDVLVARSFKTLMKNWIVKEAHDTISTDMFTFSQNYIGRAMAQVAMNVIENNLAMVEGKLGFRFENDFIFKQFVLYWCGVRHIVHLNSSKCSDLQVGLPRNFFPISFLLRHNYFIPGQLEIWMNREIYTFVTWEAYTKKLPVKKKSLLIKLARKYCPTSFQLYGNKFGKV